MSEQQSFVEICAGVGGFALGAIRSGLSPIMAYEIDSAACAMYPKVTGCDKVEQADLTQMDLSKLADAHGLVGSPPCQEFSTSGKRIGKSGVRNLWPIAIKAVKVKRPDWFIFENVPGLLYNHPNYLNQILGSFQELGYRTSFQLLNAANYGVPQTRIRLFICGWRNGDGWKWPIQTHYQGASLWGQKWVGVGTALKDWIPARKTIITPWLSNRYPQGIPDNCYFGHQQSWANSVHRWLDEPAFTVDASHSIFKIKINGQAYIVDKAALAILQDLPPCVNHRRLIGNAVPPLLSQAIFSAMFPKDNQS